MSAETVHKYANLSECERSDITTYQPPRKIRKTLDKLFTPAFVEKLRLVLEDKKDPQQDNKIGELLMSAGFTIVQLVPDVKSVIVISHPNIPGYLFKFLRTEGPVVVESKKRGKLISYMSDRIIHAQELRTFIEEQHLQYVKIPNKYFYCGGGGVFGMVVVEKVAASKTRTMKDLTQDEVREMLRLVQAGHGILDLKSKNIILTDRHIYFIDTEREKGGEKWATTLSFGLFAKELNPQLLPFVEEWYQNVSSQNH